MAQIYRKSALERMSSPDKLDCMLTVTSPMSWLIILAVVVICGAVVVWSIFGNFPETVSAQGMVVSPQRTNTVYSSDGGTVIEITVDIGDTVANGVVIAKIKDVYGNENELTADCSGIVSSILISEGQEIYPLSEILRVSPDTDEPFVTVLYVPVATVSELECGMETKVFVSAQNNRNGIEAEIICIDSYATTQQAMCEVMGFDGQMAAYFSQYGPVAAVTCEFKRDSSGEYCYIGKNTADTKLGSGEIVTAEILVDNSAPIYRVFPAWEEE